MVLQRKPDGATFATSQVMSTSNYGLPALLRSSRGPPIQTHD